jgi:hypothetical protein
MPVRTGRGAQLSGVRRIQPRMIAALWCTLLLSGCITDFLTQPGSRGFQPPSSNTRLVLDPETISLDAIGARGRYTASWWDSGTFTPAGSCTWTIDDPSVASVSGDGLVTAITNGSTVVRATCGATTASAAVGVWQKVMTIAINPDEVELDMGDNVRVVAVPRDANGNLIDRPVAFGWTSSNELSVEVTPDAANPSRATITRWWPGRAMVEAHSEGKAGAVRVEQDD